MLCFPTKTTFHFIVSKWQTTFSLAFTTEMQNPLVLLHHRAQILIILAPWKLLIYYYYYTYLPPFTHPFLPLSLPVFLPLPAFFLSLLHPTFPHYFPLFRTKLPLSPIFLSTLSSYSISTFYYIIIFPFSYFHLYFHPGVDLNSPSPVYFLCYLSPPIFLYIFNPLFR